MSSFNTTTNTTSHLSVNENPDYDTDEGEASMVASKSALSTASSSKKKQGTSVLKKSASKSTNNSRRNSAASESAGSRRVSFGSPIMADNQFSPNNDTFDNNTPFTGESSASSRRSSGSRKHDNSEVSTNSVPDVSTPNSSGTEFEMSMLSTGGSTGTRRGASIISTPGSTEFARGRRVSDATFINESESEGDSDEGADTTGLDESGFTVNDSLVASAIKRKKGNYNEDSSSESENEGRTRRSSRRTKGVTHAWWKNERVVYDRVSLPVLICVYMYVNICLGYSCASLGFGFL